jgi:multicomponent K+:H+ antiporter subunit D
MAPVVLLLVLCAALTVRAGPVMCYLEDTAQSLHLARGYIDNVLPPP